MAGRGDFGRIKDLRSLNHFKSANSRNFTFRKIFIKTDRGTPLRPGKINLVKLLGTSSSARPIIEIGFDRHFVWMRFTRT